MFRSIFAIFLVSSISFASGKLQLGAGYHLKSQGVGPSMGLGVYEPIGILGLNYNMYTGGGLMPRRGEDVWWMVSKHDLERWSGDWCFAAGFQFVHSTKADSLYSDSDVHVKVSRKLW